MNTLHDEAARFQREVDAEAARIVRNGEAAPWEALGIAKQRVLDRRRIAALTPPSPTELK